jgi:subtilase family serine protease
MRAIRVGAILAVLISGLIGVAQPKAMAATRWVDVCGPVPEGYARCFSQVRIGPASSPALGAAPGGGYSPLQLKKAYAFPFAMTAGAGKTVAVVSAFDAPTVEADLNTYSAQFGLPPCTTANGCFSKQPSRGVTPAFNELWSLESTMDVQMVHAIAPGAKIILVEASSNNFVDLFQAFQYATQRAAYVTGSWGGQEIPIMSVFDPLLDEPGVSDFFSSGDSGNSVISFPASSPEVIAVGGTRLVYNANKSKHREWAWSGSGGGCSTVFAAGAIQAAFAQYPASCGGGRAVPDIAAIGDPDPGVGVYISTPFNGVTGWVALAGTSASSPIMAARAAITGVVWDAAYVYSASRQYFDVTVGNNGLPAGPGYDLVTGRGRWKS